MTEIEQAFKDLKNDLAIRPIFHQREERIEAHIFVSFIAYCLLVTLKNLARPRANGLTPRAIIEALAAIQMVDVHLPTTDGRRLVLPRPHPAEQGARAPSAPARHDPAATARTADQRMRALDSPPPFGAL